jgi:hypothetical protein
VLPKTLAAWRQTRAGAGCRDYTIEGRRILLELNAALAVILPLAVATKAWTAGPIVRVESEKNDAFRVASPHPQPDSAITRITQFQDRPAFGVFGPPF